MIIDLDNIKYYFLTCNNISRKKHMLEEFKDHLLIEVNPVTNIHKHQSAPTGFSRILDMVCIDQDRNKPFKPFIILEDDTKKYRKFPSNIDIPDDTDILYIGLSKWGLKNTKNGHPNSVCFKNINANIIRIYNMLSLHGIMICSLRGLLTIQKCMLEGYFKNIVWDVFTANIQPYLNVYALKNPLVYQYKLLGGEQTSTLINYIDKDDKNIPYDWINKTNVSIVTMNTMNIDNLLKDLGTIEKKIHISWKTKNILDLDFNIIKYGIKQLKEFNPDYTFEISNDDDVEKYIMDKISKEDYDLIKNRDIVEKTDLWRLLKIFYEGGIYMDIDRFYNIPMNKIIKKDIKCILPTCGDIDFSQDIMISASNNIIYKTAIDLNLKRRKEGCSHLFTLGPITYFNAITQILLGRSIPRSKSNENWHILRQKINDSKFVDTYREDPPYNTLVYRGVKINNDKRNFYKFCDVNHWTTIR